MSAILFRRFLARPLQVAYVLPSSKGLVRRVLDKMDFAKARVYQIVLENTRKQAQWAALPPDAPGREKIRRKIIDLVTQQTEAVN